MLIKAITATKKRTATDKPNVGADSAHLQEYIQKLQKMIGCQTVYKEDGRNDTQYKKFYEIIEQEFPLLHKEGRNIPLERCLLFKIEGKSDKNILIMSHHDVVDASENWKYPPFGAEIHDGKMFGRGTVDTKTPLFAEMQAVEELLSENIEFPCNVYIASSANEETSGDGMLNALEYFKTNKIHFETVLDEGGAIVDGMVPTVKRRCAMIAVHEKGRHAYRCTARKDTKADGGHSGLTCKSDNPIVRMSQFICEAENIKYIRRFYPEVEATFLETMPYMSYPLRCIFTSWKFFRKPMLGILPKVNAQVGAMLGTTVSFNKIDTVDGKDHIQSKEVQATAFFRCVREDDLERDVETFKKAAEKYGIAVELESSDYCRPADFKGASFDYLRSVINEIFPSVVVAPYLLTAGTDARRLSDVADNIYRFAPISLSKEQFATVHSDNENLDISSIGECVNFYKKYITGLNMM